MTQTNLPEALNAFLADATVLYQKLRAFHWYVEGRHFFALHAKFEEYYDQWADAIDEVAERILTVGGRPVPTLKEALERSHVNEYEGPLAGGAMVQALVADLEHMIHAAEGVIDQAEEVGDRGTAALLDGIRDAQQKNVWMLKAWLREADRA